MLTCPFSKQECNKNCALFFHNPYDDKTSCSFRVLAFASVEITEVIREIAENYGEKRYVSRE